MDIIDGTCIGAVEPRTDESWGEPGGDAVTERPDDCADE